MMVSVFVQSKSGIREGSFMYLHALPNSFSSDSKLYILWELTRECLLMQHSRHDLMGLANHKLCHL